MELGPASYGLGFVAGVLSILSPCVLPLVPIVAGSAAAAHPLGPLALASGLTLSFTAIGLFVATIGFAIGLDADWFRSVAAMLLIAFGIVMLSDRLQQRLAAMMASLSAAGDRSIRAFRLEGVAGQGLVGVFLGLVWAPCVGPTLGAASTLASQGRDLGQVALVMLLFGVGAGLPLALIGFGSSALAKRARGDLLRAGQHGKEIFAVLMMLVGLGILTGWDRRVEAWLVEISPSWLTTLTTRY